VSAEDAVQIEPWGEGDLPHRFLHAFPSVGNAPSNAICRKLGFTLLEECEFEYPPGTFMQCNDWCLDLFGRS
jgi:RimJ/RimL family protein N-acetyltransferase